MGIIARVQMADPLYWDDAYPIALLLNAQHPEVEDPTRVARDQLRHWVVALEGFCDDPNAATVEFLEQIQAEWVELKLHS